MAYPPPPKIPFPRIPNRRPRHPPPKPTPEMMRMYPAKRPPKPPATIRTCVRPPRPGYAYCFPGWDKREKTWFCIFCKKTYPKPKDQDK